MNHNFLYGGMAGYRLYLLDGRVYLQMGDLSASLSDSGCAQIRTVNTISSNDWHHVVAVRNGNNAANFKIYVDGILQATEIAGYPAMKVAGGDVYNEYGNRYVIGNGSGSGYYYNNFIGYISNVKVYNRMVGDAEALANYNSCTGDPSSTTGLVLWSKIDEGTSTTVTDYSSYHTNGALELIGFGGGAGRPVSPSCITENESVLCKTRTVTGSKVSGYRYGFNGKENDKEIKGEGNHQDYGMRIIIEVGRAFISYSLTKSIQKLLPYWSGSNNLT